MVTPTEIDTRLRGAVLFVATANLAYFVVEFAVAGGIGSVSLFADSVDFLEDAAVNVLIAIGLAWNAARRARLGMLLALLLLLPGVATAWQAYAKFSAAAAPAPWALSATGAGALVVNMTCAFVLARFRARPGSLVKAAFLSARNDALANVAIVGAGMVSLTWVSAWPDLVVGVAIAAMNAGAARAVFRAAVVESGQPTERVSA